MKNVEIRSLTVDDVFALAGMLSKITKGARAELATVLKPEKGKKPNPTELGMALMGSIFLEARDDIKAWMASLVGKDTEEFGKLPPGTVLVVIEGLVGGEDFADFFAQASQLVAKLGNKVPSGSST